MAQLDEPMEVDDIEPDFDDKENAFRHHNVLPKTPSNEKGYEELDATELSMRLRYSLSPNSTLSKSFTANCIDNKLDHNTVNNSVGNEYCNFTNSTMTRSDTMLTYPHQMSLSNANEKSSSKNVTVLQPIDSTHTQDTISHFDEYVYPSSPSLSANTPEAVTPTHEIVRPEETSPIIRGLKSVLNMFRTSQSPIPSENENKSNDQAFSSPPLTIDSPRNGDTTALLNSTPLAAKNDSKISNRISPLKESIAFKDDLERELQWQEDSTIIFSKKNEKVPIHKLFPNVSNHLNLTKNADRNLNISVEQMDISYNKTMSDIHANESLKYESHFESDSEFLDCESTFTKNDSQLDESISEKSIDTVQEDSLNATKVMENYLDIKELESSSEMVHELMSNMDKTSNLDENVVSLINITKNKSPDADNVNSYSDTIGLVANRLDEIDFKVPHNSISNSQHELHALGNNSLLENTNEPKSIHNVPDILDVTDTRSEEVLDVPPVEKKDMANIAIPLSISKETSAQQIISILQDTFSDAENQASLITTSEKMCQRNVPSKDEQARSMKEFPNNNLLENKSELILSQNISASAKYDSQLLNEENPVVEANYAEKRNMVNIASQNLPESTVLSDNVIKKSEIFSLEEKANEIEEYIQNASLNSNYQIMEYTGLQFNPLKFIENINKNNVLLDNRHLNTTPKIDAIDVSVRNYEHSVDEKQIYIDTSAFNNNALLKNIQSDSLELTEYTLSELNTKNTTTNVIERLPELNHPIDLAITTVIVPEKKNNRIVDSHQSLKLHNTMDISPNEVKRVSEVTDKMPESNTATATVIALGGTENINEIEEITNFNQIQTQSETDQSAELCLALDNQISKEVEDTVIETLPVHNKCINLSGTADVVTEDTMKTYSHSDNVFEEEKTSLVESMFQDTMIRNNDKSQGNIASCTSEEIIETADGSPFVSLSADKVASNISDKKLDVPSSPPISSKGYNFNFDEIDDPFATQTKIKVSPNPCPSPNKKCEGVPDQTAELEIHLDANKNKRKSQLENKKSLPNKQKLNKTTHDMPSGNLQVSANSQFIPQEIITKDINQFDKEEQNSHVTTEKDKIQDTVEFDEVKTISLDNKPLKETNSSSSEQSIFNSNAVISSESKSVYNNPELNDTAVKPLLVQSNLHNKTQNNSEIVESEHFEKSEFEHDEKEIQENLSDTTCSSKFSDEKDITVCEVHTEDEDTMEGPFLEPEEINEGDQFIDLGDEKDNLMQFHDFLPQEIDEAGELFIDAEAFEFLMNQNVNNEVIDSGKESLFLKFDPLFARRLTSEGVAAVLNDYQKKQIIYNMQSTSTASIPRTSTINDPNTVSELEDLNVMNSKPTMVVNPAVNPSAPIQPNLSTPNRSNRLSTTITSPAIAVIDRLLCISANNSPIVQESTSRGQSEANEALTQLRELLAEKELHVQHLREESRELKERLAILETQMNSLEAESEKRLKKLHEITERLNEKTQINKNMATVVEEYERTIASLISETEQDKKRHADERMELISERDEQTAHLANMEASFNDLHSKYEKSKQIIYSYKANEDAYKKSINQFEENLSKMQKNYETLKQHATAKLNHANSELEKINRAHESDVIKLNASIKKKDVHIHSLEESLAQKTKANEELTAICDELINKVS